MKTFETVNGVMHLGNWMKNTLSPWYGRWEHINPLNIPGPFYGAMTDTCCMGPDEAPANVTMDQEGMEVVFRQPRNKTELEQVISAAECDPFNGYGFDGNDYWHRNNMREWLERISDYYHLIDLQTSPNAECQIKEPMSDSELLNYLNTYLFLLENRRLPKPEEALPELQSF